jgi:spermidine/putrescine transport system ATP-binding protein
MQGASVELRAIGKSFDGHPAVVDVTLAVERGEFFSLLGPSGCGKTTLLRLIAGFEIPSCGEILLDGAPVTGLPPRHRPLNLVFQHYALFPHMSVYKNVAFGLEMLKLPQAEIEQRVRQVLDLVHLSGLEKRYPKQLSGGQQQRAALARAIVTEPPVLLLDEPLGALDLKLRKAMQLELKNLQRRLGLTFIHVTHDQEEALAVSDRLAVMYAGRVLQIGTPEAIYEHPKSRFVADFIGEANLFEGEVKARAGAYARVAVNGVEFNAYVRSEAVSAGSPVLLTLRPEKIALDRQPLAEGDNSFLGRIEEAVYLGTDTRYTVRLGDRLRVTVRQQNHTGERLARGESVYLSWSALSSHLLPAEA